jgi:hypothetical protein
MPFLLLFIPIINALIVTEIHRDSLYHPQSVCSFIRNASFSNDASIQTCIWECVYEQNCQTAIYYINEKKCTMFAEFSTTGHIQSSGGIQASVIRYKKNHGRIDYVLSNEKIALFQILSLHVR